MESTSVVAWNGSDTLTTRSNATRRWVYATLIKNLAEAIREVDFASVGVELGINVSSKLIGKRKYKNRPCNSR